MGFKESDTPGVFTLTLAGQKLDKEKKCEELLTDPNGVPLTFPLAGSSWNPLVGRIFNVNQEEYNVVAHREDLLQVMLEIDLVKNMTQAGSAPHFSVCF